MGLQIGEIVPKKEITLDSLKGKVVAVDAYNILYQFLTTIRQVDGTLLMDSKGRITSHLSGLFYRFTNLMSKGIKPVFVFDGEVPKLKHAELAEREKRKKEAAIKYEEAKKKKELEEMAKFARQTTKLSDAMIEESKKLINTMGISAVQAPSEGEAQAAFITKRGDAFATASQDFDSLLFGSLKLVQNLTLARKRKLASGAFAEVRPELIELKEVLSELKLTQEQLIILGVLIGTDYNPGGYKGIGPKKALELIHKHKIPKNIFEAAAERAKEEIDFDPTEIVEVFKEIPVTEKYKIKFAELNVDEIKKILCKEHNFSEERVESALQKLKEAREKAKQSALEKFF